MINTDASGQGSLQYGKTSNHVLALRAVLMNGEILDTSAVNSVDVLENIDALKLSESSKDSIKPLRNTVKKKSGYH